MRRLWRNRPQEDGAGSGYHHPACGFYDPAYGYHAPMYERHMHDASYRPLKDFVSRKGGLRLAMHGGLRDQLVEQIVADWPIDCPIEHVEEVVRARIRLKVRERYGSVLGVIVLSAFVNLIVRLVVEWWFQRNSHRVLMAGWSQSAQANSDV